MSTGEFSVTPAKAGEINATLARLSPGEVLVSETLIQAPELFEALAEWKSVLSVQPPSVFDSAAGNRRLREAFGVATLDGLGTFGRAELAAAGALLAYGQDTQKARRGQPARTHQHVLLAAAVWLQDQRRWNWLEKLRVSGACSLMA